MPVRARVAGYFVKAWGVFLLALPALSAACTATANVDDAYMALDNAGDRKRNVFFTDTAQIFCVAEFAASRTDVTLNMRLHQLSRYDFVQNTLVQFDAYPAEVEIAPGSTSGRSKQTLALTKVDAAGNTADGLPYAAGDYECQVFLDGKLQKSVKFSIQFPPCPDIQIQANATCLGFYRMGDKCPELGAASLQGLFCSCQTPCTKDTENAPAEVDSYAPVGAACPVVRSTDANGTVHVSGETQLGSQGNLTGGDWKCDPLQ